MSILVQALNLRLSEDEKVDLRNPLNFDFSETAPARRRWLECNLTRESFRAP